MASVEAPLTPEERQQHLKEFMDFWNFDLQVDMLMEEAMELALAVRRFRRGRETLRVVMEEAVDVQVMIDQMMTLPEFSKEFQSTYDFKLRRTMRKLIQRRAEAAGGVTDCSCRQGILCFVHDPGRKKTGV